MGCWFFPVPRPPYVCPCVRCPGPLGSCSPVCPLGALLCLCGVLGHLATLHWCARSVRCFACAVSWATGPSFTSVPARCVALRVRCRGPLGSCSPECPLGALLSLCGVLGHLAPVHRCARSVCCLCVRCPGPLGSCSPVCQLGVLFCLCGVPGHLAPVHRCARSASPVCAVSWATWLLFTGVPARRVVLPVRCPGAPGSCSPVCLLGALFCLCGVLGHLAPVHQCVRSVRCLCVRRPGPLGSCLPVCPLGVLCCVRGVLGHLAPVHRCARSVCCLCVRCPGPLGFCSPVCPLGALLCVCSVLGHLAPVHRCARSARSFACAVSWATWLLFTGVPAQHVALRVRCPGPLGSCSPVCPLGTLLCVCGVLRHLAPVHRCARSALPVCAESMATWLLFTGVLARRVVLRVRCPRAPGSCSPVCLLGALFCLCGVLGHLTPVHQCARSVRCLCVRRPGPLASCLPVCLLGVLCCNRGVLGHLAPVHRCARSVFCLCVRCPGPLGSCSPVCPLGALLCVCGVLGHLAPVHRCARSARCFACAVSWATWLLFTGVPARHVALRVRRPGPLGSCSPVCPLGTLLCVCGVLGHLAPPPVCPLSGLLCVCGVLGHLAAVHQCARSVRCPCVRCPRPFGSCSPVYPLGVLCCVCGVLGHLAPVHRCALSSRWFACAVSWATWLLFTGVPARCVACVCVILGQLAPVYRCARLACCVASAVSWATWLLFTGVPARYVACVCGVLDHLAPVQRCARSARCFACAVSWATWLLCTGVPARRVALRVRCPAPLGSCSPVCPLGTLLCVCGVLGHLAPVHRCARSAGCFACAVSWVTWLLLTGVPTRCVACVCGVHGHLAPVHWCARSVWCFASVVSWATWLPFTGVPTRCVVLRVQCPGPLSFCSPVRSPAVLCGVLGPLAPVHRCARSVCCAVGCVCGMSLRGAHSSIRTVAIRSRQGLGTLRARTRLSGRRLFVAGRGWVPSGRTRAHLDGGCSVAGRAWVRCRGCTCPSGQPLELLGTCRRAVVRCLLCALSGFAAPGGRRCLAPVCVPWLWPAACLSGVPRGPAWRRSSSCPVALGAPDGSPDALVPFPTRGACAPGFTGWLRGARGGRPRPRLIVPAAGPRGGRGTGLAPRRIRSGTRDGVVPGGSLRRRSWAACAAVVGVCGPGH